MKSLVAWLQRLATVTPELGPSIDYFRVCVHGADPLDIGSWILSVEPQGLSGHSPQALGPEAWSVLRLPDAPNEVANCHTRHRLAADLACLLSLALERTITIPIDFAIHVPQLQKVVFQPAGQIVDTDLLGPLPADAKQRISTYATAVAGLLPDDQDVIGAAGAAYHGALLLFDKEPRAAYMLLVAGIEVLSRRYGSPPTQWEDWEAASNWDELFTAQCLTVEQAAAMQARLMADRQLRLGGTFRTYASRRPRDSFWDKSLDHWVPVVDANTGAWLPPTKSASRTIADLLPRDRAVLEKSLAKSYQLRSAVVHEVKWFDLMTLGQPLGEVNYGEHPLSFPVLRALLGELIWVEIANRTSTAVLPDFQLLRQPQDVS